MAKLPDLVRAVSANTGFSEASVKILARSLREANWIQTGGRGRHGAEMGPADGASLILGLASPGEWTNAGSTLRKLARCHAAGVIVQQQKEFSICDPSIALGGREIRDLDVRECLTLLINRYCPSERNDLQFDAPDISPNMHVDDILRFFSEIALRGSSGIDVEDDIRVSAISITSRFTEFYGTDAILRFMTESQNDFRVYFSSSRAKDHQNRPRIGLSTTAMIPGEFVDTVVRCILEPNEVRSRS